MAVTQQLARLTWEQLLWCRSSVDEVHRLCSFELLAGGDYLDLDWARTPLLRMIEYFGCDDGATAALRRAVAGDAELNPAYRGTTDSVFEHPVTALEHDAVATIAHALRRIDPAAVVAALPTDATAARAVAQLTGFDGHPGPYLHHHLAVLREFYLTASQRGLAMVLWWD